MSIVWSRGGVDLLSSNLLANLYKVLPAEVDDASSSQGRIVRYTSLFISWLGCVAACVRHRLALGHNQERKHELRLRTQKMKPGAPHFAYHRLTSRGLCRFHHQLMQGENRMFLSVLQCALRRTLAVVLAGALTATGWAQTASAAGPAVARGPATAEAGVHHQGCLQNRVHTSLTRLVRTGRAEPAPPNLSNTPRIQQLMQNGKLMLSTNDVVGAGHGEQP